MSPPLVVTAPAKINLFLHVGGKRSDGYHDLQSLVAFAVFGDEISLEPDDGFSLWLSGPFAALLSASEENLVLRAAKVFANRAGVKRGVRIRLRKNLPIASGLGGGSADAAAMLRGLTRLWQLDFDHKFLFETAEQLGADVPVCVASQTSWMEGKGERVHRLPSLPKAGVVLVNPGVQISTAKVFATLGPHRALGMASPKAPFQEVSALVEFLRSTSNDLEAPARTIAPIIANVLRKMDELPDTLFSRMSGSGATCFALFADEERATAAARLLRKIHPEWWIRESAFLDLH